VPVAHCPHLVVRKLLDHPMRDPSVCVAPDGSYYLTGTTGGWWQRNDGIEVWNSSDLRRWEPLGLVWSLESGTWQREEVVVPHVGGPMRVVWAPEIHYARETFWLAYSMPGHGSSLLRSASGTARGPYEDVSPSGPLAPGEIDGSLFIDDDGQVWFVWQGGRVARMNDEMTGFASAPFDVRPADHDHVGFEGAFLFRHLGLYHLFAAEYQLPDGRLVDPDVFRTAYDAALEDGDDYVTASDRVGMFYSCVGSFAENIDGPWSDRYIVAAHAGHNTVFRDGNGAWWSTFFGNDHCAPVRERPALFRLRLELTGRWSPAVT
jgi:beta-xylosidase